MSLKNLALRSVNQDVQPENLPYPLDIQLISFRKIKKIENLIFNIFIGISSYETGIIHGSRSWGSNQAPSQIPFPEITLISFGIWVHDNALKIYEYWNSLVNLDVEELGELEEDEREEVIRENHELMIEIGQYLTGEIEMSDGIYDKFEKIINFEHLAFLPMIVFENNYLKNWIIKTFGEVFRDELAIQGKTIIRW